jgi:hypothetical protein
MLDRPIDPGLTRFPPVQVSLTALADSKTGRRFIKSL